MKYNYNIIHSVIFLLLKTKTIWHKINLVQKLRRLYCKRVEKERWITSSYLLLGTEFFPNTYPIASNGSGDNWWHKNKHFILLWNRHCQSISVLWKANIHSYHLTKTCPRKFYQLLDINLDRGWEWYRWKT